jgi:hypothetical protein
MSRSQLEELAMKREVTFFCLIVNWKNWENRKEKRKVLFDNEQRLKEFLHQLQNELSHLSLFIHSDRADFRKQKRRGHLSCKVKCRPITAVLSAMESAHKKPPPVPL